MARSVLVDAGFLVAPLSRRDAHHPWAARVGAEHPPPWKTCNGVLSEAFHLLGARGLPAFAERLRRGVVRSTFVTAEGLEAVLGLLDKYASVPMSFADARLVRMTELDADPVLLTTDTDFRIYRRHSRLVVPAILPG